MQIKMMLKLMFIGLCAVVWSSLALAQEPDRRRGIAVVNPVFRSVHRQTIDLSGTWDFATDPEKVGDDKKWYTPDAVWTNQTTLKVPGCWAKIAG